MGDVEAPRAFKLNAPDVICEAIDGDLVLVHFESGLYYSIRGSGAWVGQMLVTGISVGDIVDRIVERFGLPREIIEKDVQNFVTGLVSEKLLLPTDAIIAQADALAPVPIRVATYEAPRYEKFDDMADQLLLDKIEDEDQQPVWVTETTVLGP